MFSFRSKKSLHTRTTHTWMWGHEGPGSRSMNDFVAYAQEGYAQNPILYRAVSLIARSVASVPWLVTHNGHPCEQHPLLALLQQPNTFQAGVSFVESVVSYLLLSGNTYIQIIGTDEQPLALHTMRPDRMTLVPDEQGHPHHYEYQISPQKKLSFPCHDQAHKTHILHWRFFDPFHTMYGMSPLSAAALSVDQHNAVSRHNLSLLENGGRPTGALMVKPQHPHTMGMSAEQRQDLKEQVQSHFTGSANAGKVLVLEGPMEWKEMGVSLKDMDYVSGKNLSAREIAQALGVPPLLVGVPGDATFANYREARLHFWEDTVLPLLDALTHELNRCLAPRYGDGITLDYDTDAIPALSPKREMVWSKIASADFLTINEKRQAIGYPPIHGGDRVGGL